MAATKSMPRPDHMDDIFDCVLLGSEAVFVDYEGRVVGKPAWDTGDDPRAYYYLRKQLVATHPRPVFIDYYIRITDDTIENIEPGGTEVTSWDTMDIYNLNNQTDANNDKA